jgi:hypothetical protein
VTILNINSSYLRGGINQDIIFRVLSRVGAISHLEYIVSCPTNTSVPENTILSGPSANSTNGVTIQRNVVSVGLGEDSLSTWNTPNLSEVKCRKLDNTFEQANNDFKIKITSIGENNLNRISGAAIVL